MPYTFQSVKSMEKLTDSSKLYNFIENFSDYENQFSLICGKIKALFGQPIYETENLENLFSYCILATSEEAEEVYLDIYRKRSLQKSGVNYPNPRSVLQN